MNKVFFVVFLAILVLVSVLSRPYSLGVKLQEKALNYSEALASNRIAEAKEMMTSAFSSEFSEEFLHNLDEIVAPSVFKYDGIDSKGYRMIGYPEDRNSGTRIIWFSTDGQIKVTADTAIDNIMGSALMLCQEAARNNPHGNCPISGIPYQYNEETGLVVCVSGHLGVGLIVNSNECELQREAVALELQLYIEAGFEYPEKLEDMFIISDGAYGRRGGYSCPDNGYKYYELQNGQIYCPYHQNQLEAEEMQQE